MPVVAQGLSPKAAAILDLLNRAGHDVAWLDVCSQLDDRWSTFELAPEIIGLDSLPDRGLVKLEEETPPGVSEQAVPKNLQITYAGQDALAVYDSSE